MRITSIATQVRVANLERALQFYLDTLGFEEEFRFRDFYAGVRSGESRLHLKLVEMPDPSVAFVREGDHLHLYFRVSDLDAAFQDLQGKALVVYPITTKPWGDREFTVRDPDGHTLCFAQADPSTA
ncbi:MAG: VOC family protein [Myxococcales bacterium]